MKKFKVNFAASRYFLPAILSIFLFSFSVNKGGDSFEVYLNGKMLFQQYVSMHQPVKSLSLQEKLSNGEITVYYKHCGKTGTDRVISIKNADNKILKTWNFPNDAANPSAMICKVKDVINLEKNNGKSLGLYYSSKEMSEARLLAVIIIAGEEKTDTKAGR